MTDFFVSYNSNDRTWAEWIAFALEERGFTTVIQAWDFRPGSNFVLEMQRAATEADRTIMVLSPDYLKSIYAAPEWAAAFAQDPEGRERQIVPVMVRTCAPTGLISSIVQIRVVDANEDDARKLLLDGVDKKRAKPSTRPAFPGNVAQTQHKEFPGTASQTVSQSPRSIGYMPNLRRPVTEVERRRFAREGFTTIRRLFEGSLAELSARDQSIDTDFQPTTEIDFRAEVFVQGNSRCRCRIWMGGMHSVDNICYNSGRYAPDNSCNEIIALASDKTVLAFHALMDMGFSRSSRSIDTKNMDADQAAQYLWMSFIAPLER